MDLWLPRILDGILFSWLFNKLPSADEQGWPEVAATILFEFSLKRHLFEHWRTSLCSTAATNDGSNDRPSIAIVSLDWKDLSRIGYSMISTCE